VVLLHGGHFDANETGHRAAAVHDQRHQ
jgi:hypothetical protein